MSEDQPDNSMAIVGCEECGNEVTVPVTQSNCPICGGPLWEDDEIPPSIEKLIWPGNQRGDHP